MTWAGLFPQQNSVTLGQLVCPTVLPLVLQGEGMQNDHVSNLAGVCRRRFEPPEEAKCNTQVSASTSGGRLWLRHPGPSFPGTRKQRAEVCRPPSPPLIHTQCCLGQVAPGSAAAVV
jgi:hypothetical protein